MDSDEISISTTERGRPNKDRQSLKTLSTPGIFATDAVVFLSGGMVPVTRSQLHYSCAEFKIVIVVS